MSDLPKPPSLYWRSQAARSYRMAAEASERGDETAASDLRREGDACMSRAEQIEIRRVQEGLGMITLAMLLGALLVSLLSKQR